MGAMLSDPIAKQIKSSRPWGAPTETTKKPGARPGSGCDAEREGRVALRGWQVHNRPNV